VQLDDPMEIESPGEWPGIISALTPPLPAYELGRDVGGLQKLKRKRSVEEPEKRPLPGRFHVALSPEAMRGRIKAPRKGKEARTSFSGVC
jgi:hypothetical protein